MNYEINDIRFPKDFKGISFSKHKKTEVKTALTQALLKAKLEPSCYWAAELICAGHYGDLWEILLHYVGKHIHLGNPKLVIYLHMRYEMFESIISSGTYLSELHLRNNEKMRKLFAEIIAVIALSNKKNSFEPIRINRIEEFDITQMTERLKAPSLQYIQDVFRPDDPKELVIAVNEFAYHISSEGKNTVLAFYWLEWILEYESLCHAKKEKCVCERRDKMPVESKMQMGLVWIIWECILYECDRRANNPLLQKTVKSLLTLFCLQFTHGVVRRRKFLIYSALSILTEWVDTTEELVKDKDLVNKIVEKVDQIYAQVKMNEVSPQTDYLFMDSKKSNLDKTIAKLEKMNQFESSFIPRANGGTDPDKV
jgi:hypothetical protein